MPKDQEETEQELLDSEDAGIKHTKLREECVMEKCWSALGPPVQRKSCHTCRDRQFPFRRSKCHK